MPCFEARIGNRILPAEKTYTDPFDNATTLEYDGQYLFIQSSTDTLGNTTRAARFDYRALAPAEIEDISTNHTEAYFDLLGRVIAIAVKGKGNEALPHISRRNIGSILSHV